MVFIVVDVDVVVADGLVVADHQSESNPVRRHNSGPAFLQARRLKDEEEILLEHFSFFPRNFFGSFFHFPDSPKPNSMPKPELRHRKYAPQLRRPTSATRSYEFHQFGKFFRILWLHLRPSLRFIVTS